MAEERLTFKIGSEFSGDGFNKANAAVKTSGKVASQMRGAFGGILNDLSQMDNKVGELIGSFNGMAQSIQQLGVAGAALYGVKFGAEKLADYIEHMNDGMIDMIQHANDFNEQLKKIHDNAAIQRMKDALKEATTEAHNAMQTIKETADAVNALAGAKAESAMAQANEQLAKLMKQKAEAVAGALGEFQKQVAAAKGDLAIAQHELETAHKNAAAAVEKANRDYDAAQQQQLQAIDNIVAAQRAVEIAETDYKKAKIHGSIKEAEYQQTLEKAREALIAAEKAKAKADNDVAIAIQKQETATSKMNTTIIQAEAKVIQLTAARDEAQKKLAEQNAKEDELGMSTEELAKTRKEEAKRAKDEMEQVKKDAKKKHDEMQAQIIVLENQKNNLQQNANDIDDAQAAYSKHHNWMGAGKQWERTKSGGLKEFGDYQKSGRWKDRFDRDEQSNKLYNEGQQRRADDIQRRLNRKGSYVSKADKDFLDKWNAYKDQLVEEEDIDTKIEDWKTQQLQLATDTKDVLDSIETNLKDALALN